MITIIKHVVNIVVAVERSVAEWSFCHLWSPSGNKYQLTTTGFQSTNCHRRRPLGGWCGGVWWCSVLSHLLPDCWNYYMSVLLIANQCGQTPGRGGQNHHWRFPRIGSVTPSLWALTFNKCKGKRGDLELVTGSPTNDAEKWWLKIFKTQN